MIQDKVDALKLRYGDHQLTDDDYDESEVVSTLEINLMFEYFRDPTPEQGLSVRN